MAKRAAAKAKKVPKDLDASWDPTKTVLKQITWDDVEGCLDAVIQSHASRRYNYVMVKTINSIKIVERDMSTHALVAYLPGYNGDGYIETRDSRFLGIVREVDPVLWSFILDHK